MIISLKDITVGDRYRKTFTNIDKLAESIQKIGLIHPIVVDENNQLIAGERRLRACKLLKLEEIEVKHIQELTDIEKLEIELEENIQREQVSWQEEVAGKAQLHRLKQKIHGSSVKGHESDGWGVKDTAEALGQSMGSVSMDIQLARGMKAFPELLKEKTKSGAYKKFKGLQEKVLQNELDKRLAVSKEISHPDVILGDCIEEMKKMPSESVDLILTDPPYGIDIGDAQTFGGSSEQKTYSDGEYDVFDMLDKAIKEMYRVLRQDRHMYMFFAIDKYEPLCKLLSKHGFTFHHIPLIWDKGSGSYPSQSTTYVHSYEPFLHISKGKRGLNGTPKDLFSVKRVPANRKIHPSQKPCSLLRDIIGFSTLSGETVLDPFCGSGSTLVAAKESNRKGIGIERDAGFHAKVVDRLTGEELPDA